MFCTILLELLLPFRQFKETANIRWTTISAQTLRENKTKWWVAPTRKRGAAAEHLLKQTADCTAPQSQIDWTMEPLNQKSQIAQEYGLLPADARQQQGCNKKNMQFVRMWVFFFLVHSLIFL